VSVQRKLIKVALRTSLLYGVIAGLWILFSDRLWVGIVSDPATLGRLSTYKGWFFVVVTALLLYSTLRVQLRRWDITERKRTEEALRTREAIFRAVVENSHDGILLVGSDRQVKYVSPSFSRISGYRPEEITGNDGADYVHPDDQTMIESKFRDVLETPGAIVSGEYRIRHKRGHWIWMETTATNLLDDPHVRAVVLNSRDVTDRKRAEEEKTGLQEQLRQAQKMEAIGTLAGGIAHDFNNILSAILGYAELSILDLEEGSIAKKNLERSMKAAHRAKDLVQQILTFSRQGKQERKLLSVKPIVKEALKFLRASLPATIEIQEEIEENPGPIEADPTQIHQVLMNLCTNAAHAMDEKGGELSVSLSNLDLDGNNSGVQPRIEAGPYVRLRVSDTGHGMAPEILGRIFDPYFTTKEPGKGTGLGLAMVHGIVKSHGGEIRVSSDVGKGSIFDVYFPRIEIGNVPREVFNAESLPLGDSERILLVDDEKGIIDVGREILERLGYEVTVRTSSIEALELFRARSNRFDLVITDMTMPNMTGDRLAQELLKIRPDIPVLLCTGFSEHITEERAKAIGIRELLLKPLAMTELAKTMRRLLDSRGSMKN